MEKRSFVLSGHATSVSLEPDFWRVLEHASGVRGLSMTKLVAKIDSKRDSANLASALRRFALAEALAGRGGQSGNQIADDL